MATEISSSRNEQAGASAKADGLRGFLLAFAAYLLWGFQPLYMKAVDNISPFEVLAHRIVWSLPIAAITLVALRQTGELRRALGSPRLLGMAALTAALITMNWGIYIWAIGSGHALDAALGYFINPLFSIFLGAVLLKEKLHRVQFVAIALAGAAVALLTLHAGKLPFVAVGLTVSWGFYAFLRKTLPIGATQGFLLEILLLSPAAFAFLAYLAATGTAHFLIQPSQNSWLLAASGLVTAVPLLLYGNGAKLLKLSTIGIMQYIAPTMIFLIAVFYFREPFDGVRMLGFAMIWLALAIFTAPMLLGARKG